MSKTEDRESQGRELLFRCEKCGLLWRIDDPRHQCSGFVYDSGWISDTPGATNRVGSDWRSILDQMQDIPSSDEASGS